MFICCECLIAVKISQYHKGQDNLFSVLGNEIAFLGLSTIIGFNISSVWFGFGLVCQVWKNGQVFLFGILPSLVN